MKSAQLNTAYATRSRHTRHLDLPVAVLLFFVVLLILFLFDNRNVNLYDEGLSLTSAMRIVVGQVIHRDFYYMYGPANIYMTAALFKLFGQSVLVGRLWILTQAAFTAVAIYLLARRLSNIIAALVAVAASVLWTICLDYMELLALWSTFLLAPAVQLRLSRRRLFTAGVMVGVAALFRYDIGFGLAAVHLVVLAVAAALREQSAKKGSRAWVADLWPYLLGCSVVVVPLLLTYRVVGVMPGFVYDIVQYPAKYYHAARNLPFPRVGRRNFDDSVIYVLPLVIAMGFYGSIYGVIRSWQTGGETRRPVPVWAGWLGAFGLVAVAMYLKGLTRITSGSLFMCMGSCIMIAVVLYAQRSSLPTPVRWVNAACIALVVLGGMVSAKHNLRSALGQRALMLNWFALKREQAPAPQYRWWCNEQNVVSKGPCYFLDEDHIQAITYLDQHTRPSDTLFVGLDHMDRIYINDHFTYFAAQRQPATKWTHFDPFLENRADIQHEMIGEIERNRPPYVILDSAFENLGEPNGSSVSTGVHLLDNYFATRYSVAVRFGELTILKRQP